jgi:cob(I)alamin adenosyltransferase
VLVNTGDGKGKSTAAFGTAMRAVARGWRVAVFQFLKSGDWAVGEEKVGRQVGMTWRAIGDGFTWDSKDMGESEAIANEAWRQARSAVSGGDFELVVLDEITYLINWGWIRIDDVSRCDNDETEHVNLIITGRTPNALIEVADTVTEMRKVKHAYDQGVMARRGIDY